MALFPLKELLDGTKRLFVGIQALNSQGQYKPLKVTDKDELIVKGTDLKVAAYFTGTSATTRNYTTDMQGFTIVNDGTTVVNFTINGITIEVKPGESYANRFDAFRTVTVAATGAFRAQVLA